MSTRPTAQVEALYRREAAAWGLVGLALGLVEGATAAILLKKGYAGVVGARHVLLDDGTFVQIGRDVVRRSAN